MPKSFLAEILARFNRRHPLVEVSVVCEASTDLGPQVAAGALDLALITDYEGLKGLELLREEPLVWVAAERFQVEAGTPIPLALGSTTCCWRRATEHALTTAAPGVAQARFYSKNFSAIGTVLRAGIGGDDPARFGGRSRPQGSRTRGRIAGAALEPHGAYPRAGAPQRGSEGPRGIDPRDDRLRGPSSRLTRRDG